MTKKKPKHLHKKAGRPTKLDEITIKKLEDCFMAALSDEQACYIADITPATLYNYQQRNPEFLEKKNTLKTMTTAKAKINLSNQIRRKDIEASKWWLERKAKHEFSTRSTTEIEGQLLQIVVQNEKDKEALEVDYAT